MSASPLVEAAARLRDSVDDLAFSSPVTHTLNPLAYAWEPHRRYLSKWGKHPTVVLVGMNPGPWGMAQTGIPFGEVAHARDWIGVEAPVERPEGEHPKRPVLGFGCERSEVSGRRLWGWAAERFGTPERFFERFFVLNYCPLIFLEESGRNRTPDKLKAAERAALFPLCDQGLREHVTALDPEWVLGVGRFAEDRARSALAGMTLRIGRILHPSPANPHANRGWVEAVEAELAALGLETLLPLP